MQNSYYYFNPIPRSILWSVVTSSSYLNIRTNFHAIYLQSNVKNRQSASTLCNLRFQRPCLYMFIVQLKFSWFLRHLCIYLIKKGKCMFTCMHTDTIIKPFQWCRASVIQIQIQIIYYSVTCHIILSVYQWIVLTASAKEKAKGGQKRSHSCHSFDKLLCQTGTSEGLIFINDLEACWLG